jgi:ATP-binding cassette, subfamily B, bacterial
MRSWPLGHAYCIGPRRRLRSTQKDLILSANEVQPGQGPAAAAAIAPGQYGRLLGSYLRPLWRQVTLLGAALVAGIGLELLNPQILRLFIDEAEAGGSLNRLTGLAVIYMAAAVVLQGLTVGETWLSGNVGLTATNRLRADLALHALQLDLAYHNARTPGEMIERVDGDVARLGNFFSRFVVRVVGNTLLLLGVLVLLFGIDWRIGLTMTAFALGAMWVIVSLRDVAVPYWHAARQANATLFGFLEERFATTEDIRANGAREYVLRRLYERSRQLLHRERLAGLVSASTGSGTTFLFALGTVIGLGVGAWLFQAGALTLGTVFLIFTYTQLLTRPIEQITRQMQDLQQAGASLARILGLLSERSRIEDGEERLPDGPLEVAFESVAFGYVAEEPILRGVSFRLAPGDVMGLLGRTGSGKTTVTRLLFRLYDPAQGNVRLAGTDLRDLKLDDIRRRVGLVTQDIQLFNASVRDNLTFFDPSIDDERIRHALAELGLTDWLAGLPDGLDTRLASAGSGLSAGQAQLLAFARVFLKDPGVVILDEASSRLDPASEARLERAVDKLLRDRTVIIIAHSLSTVQRADHILILDHGLPVELGRRETLAADPNSRFSLLLQVGSDDVLA